MKPSAFRSQAGRAFTAHDDATSQQVAIVNQEFLRKYLNGKPAIGTHIRVHAMDPAGPRYVEREIVGVAGQVKVEGPGEKENAVEVYVPLTQNAWFGASLAVRTEGDPLALTRQSKRAVAKLDSQLAVTRVRTMDEIVAESVARPRFRARLVGGFAVLALLLSAVGIFAVLAFGVSQRKREFGIRMALGARIADVVSLVLTRGVKIVVAGIAAGVIGAAALARSLAALLFGVKPLDAASFLCGGGAARSRRAWPPPLFLHGVQARVDPAIALRDE